MMSNKNKSRMRQYGSLLLCSILCVVFLAAPVRAADLDEDIDATETTKTNVTAKPQSEVVKAAWYEDSYHITDKNGSRSGYGYEYEQAVSAYTGWDYDYVTGNWEELLKKLQNGEIDLMSSLSYTDERAKTMLFSDLPMGEEKYYKNDCLKIIMDIYEVIGSIGKLLVIIQMTKGQSAPLLFFRVFFNYTIMRFLLLIIRNSNK